MTIGIARTTDVFVGICVCCPNPPIPMTGTVVGGSSDITANGIGCARVGDVVLGLCGHIGVISSGSGTNVTMNGLEMAVSGSAVTGCLIGTITTGSSDVVTG